MARTFYLSSTASDLSGGADFSLALLESTSASSPLVVGVTNSSTDTSYAWTPSGIPSATGATGNYTVEVNVTAANSAISLVVAIGRVNSSGVLQGSEVTAASQSLGSTGVKTFTFTNANLGTWATGDRLRVGYRFTSSNSHGGEATVTIDRNTTDAEVVTPYLAPTIRNIGLAW